jgi:hypothetical protein
MVNIRFSCCLLLTFMGFSCKFFSSFYYVFHLPLLLSSLSFYYLLIRFSGWDVNISKFNALVGSRRGNGPMPNRGFEQFMCVCPDLFALSFCYIINYQFKMKMLNSNSPSPNSREINIGLTALIMPRPRFELGSPP